MCGITSQFQVTKEVTIKCGMRGKYFHFCEHYDINKRTCRNTSVGRDCVWALPRFRQNTVEK